jgi:putative transposase
LHVGSPPKTIIDDRERHVVLRAAAGTAVSRSTLAARPGKPTDNAYAEGFNASVRLECLGRCWFLELDDAREKVEEWPVQRSETS